jgi:hypothetical protein
MRTAQGFDSPRLHSVSGVVGTRSVEKTRTGVKQCSIRTGFKFTLEVDSDKAGQEGDLGIHKSFLTTLTGPKWFRLAQSIEEGDTRHG